MYVIHPINTQDAFNLTDTDVTQLMLIRSSFVSRYTQLLEERRRLVDSMSAHVVQWEELACAKSERKGAREVVALETLMHELRDNLYQEHVAGMLCSTINGVHAHAAPCNRTFTQ